MNISNVIFWLGVGIIVVNLVLRELFLDKVMFFIPSNIIGLSLIIVGWVLIQKDMEKYGCCGVAKDYQKMYVTGRPVAGTVYADEENESGLGWIL